MRIILRSLFFVIVVVIFSGCATVNTTLLDSAIPMGAGKIKTDFEVAHTLDLSILNGTITNYGVKSTIGVSDNEDIILRGYVAPSSMGAGIFLKHNLIKNDEKKRWISIVPGINIVRSTEKYTYDGVEHGHIGSFGLTLPIVMTHGKKWENSSLIARYSIDWLRVNKIYYPINRFNTSVNFQTRLRSLIVTVEVGAEHVFQGSDFVRTVPSFGIALGLTSFTE